jgi:excisionase family DNA binding protein
MVITDEDALLDYEAAAKLLGVAVRTLQRWVSEGRIDYVKLPQRGAWSGIRFSRIGLMRWIDRQTVRPRRTA